MADNISISFLKKKFGFSLGDNIYYCLSNTFTTKFFDLKGFKILH